MDASDDLVACERCGRDVEPERLWKLNINLPADGHVERRVCVVCVAEVRRFLLVQPGGSYVAPSEIEEPQSEQSRVARLGWFLLRGLVYGAIAAGVFGLVTWLSS